MSYIWHQNHRSETTLSLISFDIEQFVRFEEEQAPRGDYPNRSTELSLECFERRDDGSTQQLPSGLTA
ncbi:hypothetical protein T265_05789 [Opisthorchis viverrini]|uniref:Uncharacterized protein n=1 Tax=Opisthorchis viverrini TaxID=6198 RepID=A0A074ZJC7_OPIVI|nr:hypothetical protein T265_05789 [Opisthorchis viverrini]KER27091.1 hypothetical protein T265_05789 [Opisthorchis viverrini]